MKFIGKALVLLAFSMVLVACSGEPSGGDIKSVVEKDVKPLLEVQWKAMSGINSMMGGGQQSALPKLDDVKKVGCKADGDNAFKCDVELIITANEKKESKVIPMRFVKTSAGWQATK